MSCSPSEQKWQGGQEPCCRLSATHETNLLSHFEGAFPLEQSHAPVQGPEPQHLLHPNVRLLLTLLFLNVVGLHRPWDLRTYTRSTLRRLSGKLQPYSYRHVERFLRMLAIANADEAFTATLARWTSTLPLVPIGLAPNGHLRLALEQLAKKLLDLRITREFLESLGALPFVNA